MDVLDNFFEYLKNNYRSSNTLKSYFTDVVQFLEYAKDYKIEVEKINEYVLYLNRKKIGQQSIRRKLSALSVFYNYLNNIGGYSLNISQVIRPKQKKSLPKFLDIDETFLLIEKIENVRDKTILTLLYSSGLRLSELVGLNIEDINFSNKAILVKRKGSKQMYVPTNQKTLDILIGYINGRKSGPLFLNKSQRRLSARSIENIVKKYAKQILGKDISPHTLRHSRATHLLNNGMDLRILQRFLGHSSILATQIYTHLSIQDLTMAYDKFHPLSKEKGSN